ncbi:MAG: hypothetical protein Ct9H300mP16_08340 [Pseudomonadota bacterium]|nr:MAG: hypothetical protein Ct9H300mP16_08340 [Pseudomonadota bacterium]
MACPVYHFRSVQLSDFGAVMITLIGLAQSFAMIPMSVLLLNTTDEPFRGRVSGIRILAVYGMPMGLILGGALIEWIGVPATTFFRRHRPSGQRCCGSPVGETF